MSITSLLFWTLFASICSLTIVGYILVVKRKREATRGFSSKLFRCAWVLLCLLSVVLASFHSPTAHAKAYTNVPVQYIVCPGGGDTSAAFSTDGTWNTVQPTDTVSTTDYSGSVFSYQGTSGLQVSGNNSQCPGVYYWGWNQYYHKASWQAYLPIANNMSCTAKVYIPHWYAGAPDANYTFSVKLDNGVEQTLQTIQWSQNQEANDWYSLFVSSSGAPIYYPLPSSSDGYYSFTLTVTNGKTPWYYLGADAAQFLCQ